MNAHWTPQGWRARPAQQMPVYADSAALQEAQARLAVVPSLVDAAQIQSLRQRLAQIASGHGFLLQGGDCAESLAALDNAAVARTVNVLQKSKAALAPHPVTVTARLAGQYAKPRSSPTETRNGLTLPAYRGDGINDFVFTADARRADPARMIKAAEQATAIHALLPDNLFTCHEALLLPYEEALTRRGDDGQWYATSAHFLWLGARTQNPDGAHVEYLRGIANPVGIKCAPWTDADTLRRLIDILNPGNEPGRLTLIPRMGAAAIDDCLPPLIDIVKKEGYAVLWCCDPMHGNTIQTANGLKTRRLEDIRTEIVRSFAIHHMAGTRCGGIHLEMTGEAVTECLSPDHGGDESVLSARYETRCDPRLNPVQAQAIMSMIAAEIVRYSAAA